MCRKPGKTRRKLAELLRRDLDIEIRGEDLQTPKGAYRHATFDCAKWEGMGCRWVDVDLPGMHGAWVPVQVHSWDTMTMIVRSGGVTIIGGEEEGHIQVMELAEPPQ